MITKKMMKICEVDALSQAQKFEEFQLLEFEQKDVSIIDGASVFFVSTENISIIGRSAHHRSDANHHN